MSEPYLRKAVERDIDILFYWANDSITRENAFNTSGIEYTDHQKWFAEKLRSSDSILYIYCVNDRAIGQARIDVDGDNGLVSYSIDSEHRYQGHGGRLLSLLESTAVLDLPHLKALVARVKKSNTISQRKFEQRMYVKNEKDDYYEYCKYKES